MESSAGKLWRIPKSLSLFLDGALEDGPVLLKSAPRYQVKVKNPEWVKWKGPPFPSDYGFFKGEIDEVRIYDRGLGTGEVTEIYEGDFKTKVFSISLPLKSRVLLPFDLYCSSRSGNYADGSTLHRW